jgi:hypothetical protein
MCVEQAGKGQPSVPAMEEGIGVREILPAEVEAGDGSPCAGCDRFIQQNALSSSLSLHCQTSLPLPFIRSRRRISRNSSKL